MTQLTLARDDANEIRRFSHPFFLGSGRDECRWREHWRRMVGTSQGVSTPQNSCIFVIVVEEAEAAIASRARPLTALPWTRF
jgi:hypothetical protein